MTPLEPHMNPNMPACRPGFFILLVLLLPGAQGVRLREIEILILQLNVIMGRKLELYSKQMKIQM